MKWLGAIIIMFSLCVGLVSALTAYVPRLDAISPEDQLTLNAPAGLTNTQPPEPLFAPKPDEPIVLTAERLEMLRAANVERVRVKEFSFDRWGYKWWLVLSCVGLIGGAAIVRRAGAAAQVPGSVDAGPATARSPRSILESACADLRQAIDAAAAAKTEREQCEVILPRVDIIQREHIDAFANARGELVQRFGIGGYAKIMDRFAAGERQVNRAWSAAADRAAGEARTSLRNGLSALEQTLPLLD